MSIRNRALGILKQQAWNNHVESLEARRLFAASIDGRVLTALGGGGNDTITVTRSGLDDVRVNINGTASVFDMGDFDNEEATSAGGPNAIDDLPDSRTRAPRTIRPFPTMYGSSLKLSTTRRSRR